MGAARADVTFGTKLSLSAMKLYCEQRSPLLSLACVGTLGTNPIGRARCEPARVIRRFLLLLWY